MDVGDTGPRERALGSVLVVDDDALLLRALSRQLEHAGFGVTCADTGEAALGVMERVQPDVVIVDFVMPGIDGIAVCRAALGISPRSVVVVISADKSVAPRLRAFDAGACDFLVKPFEVAELLARLRVHLGARRRQRRDGTLSFDGIQVHLDWGVTFVRGQPIDLPRTQRRLLAALIAEPNQVHSCQELRRVTGSAGDDRAIRKHVERLRLALGDAGSVIRTVWGAGYRAARDEE